MIQALHAALLIAAEYYAHAAPGLKPARLYRSKAVQRGKSGTLIVHSSAAVKLAGMYLARIRGILPALPLRHDVKMRKYAELLLSFAKVNAAAVAVKILYIKAEAPGMAQRAFKAFCRALAKRRSGFGGAVVTHGLYHHTFPQGLYKLVRMAVYPFVGGYAHIFPPI